MMVLSLYFWMNLSIGSPFSNGLYHQIKVTMLNLKWDSESIGTIGREFRLRIVMRAAIQREGCTVPLSARLQNSNTGE